MKIAYKQAAVEDAELLVGIYNAAFYSDYRTYGECPGYGKTKEMMEDSIRNYPKFIILCDERPVGCVFCRELEKNVYEIGCLCVIPEYQGKGIGTQAMNFIKSFYADWKKLTLVTPADKSGNVKFYTEKCGFHITETKKDGHVTVASFVMER